MKNQSAQKDEQGVLEATAQAIGSTLGSLAVKTGIAKPPAAVAHAEPEAQSGTSTRIEKPAERIRKSRLNREIRLLADRPGLPQMPPVVRG